MNNRKRLISKLKKKILLSNRRRFRLKIFERDGLLIKDVYDLWVTGIEFKSDGINH